MVLISLELDSILSAVWSFSSEFSVASSVSSRGFWYLEYGLSPEVVYFETIFVPGGLMCCCEPGVCGSLWILCEVLLCRLGGR